MEERYVSSTQQGARRGGKKIGFATTDETVFY